MNEFKKCGLSSALYRPNQSTSTDTLIPLTELVLTLNNFSFNSSHFLQTKGVAMGTRMGPSYACGFTCISVNLIYCIRCPRYGLLYISETKRRFGDHSVDHLRSVHDKPQHRPVTNHFNSPSHSLGDMFILGFLQCHNDATLKLEEQHLIFRLRSLQPNGLNVD
eukprot:g47752.t1